MWQMNLLWPMDPPYQSRDALNTSTQNLADEPTLADGTPCTRAEMTCIPLHKTWQMYLHWPMDPPPVPEQRWLAYHYTKLGRWTYFGQWTPKESSIDVWNSAIPNLADKPTLAKGTPWEIENRCLEYQYTKLGRWTSFGQWTHTTRAEMSWIPVHKTWQMNLL